MTQSCDSHIINPLEILLSKIMLQHGKLLMIVPNNIYVIHPLDDYPLDVFKDYVLTWENGSLGEESRKQN